jgi:uncharacterized LabA/DUF88 family protein
MTLSAILFVDYQNVYRWARRSFEVPDEAPSYVGQFDPVQLAELLEEKGRGRFVIDQIRIYRGMPGQRYDQIGYSAAQRQIHVWRKNPKIHVFTRPIRYPKGWDRSRSSDKPKEKGIDVALAVDFVAMAFKKEYELGLIFSADTDLRPALEYVNSAEVEPKGEVVAWRGGHFTYRLTTSHNFPFCHWVRERDFEKILDQTLYTN